MDLSNKSISDLRHLELDIQDELDEQPKLVNGKLDYTRYDELHSQLRQVRAKMATM